MSIHGLYQGKKKLTEDDTYPYYKAVIPLPFIKDSLECHTDDFMVKRKKKKNRLCVLHDTGVSLRLSLQDAQLGRRTPLIDNRRSNTDRQFNDNRS